MKNTKGVDGVFTQMERIASKKITKQIIIKANFDNRGNVVDFAVERQMSDDEFVLLLSTMYGRSIKFSELFNATNKAISVIKASEKIRSQYMNMMKNIAIVDIDSGEILEEIPQGVR